MDKEKYIEAVGRRKTSTARVRISASAKASFTVNGLDSKEYFKTEVERRLISDPIIKGLPAGGANRQCSGPRRRHSRGTPHTRVHWPKMTRCDFVFPSGEAWGARVSVALPSRKDYALKKVTSTRINI